MGMKLPKGDSMKRIFAIALFLATSFMTARAALAQDVAVHVDVPFSFNVNTTTLPAGKYTIFADLDQPAVLTIRDQTNAIVAVNLAINDPSGSGKAGRLVFNHYGDQYFLNEIRFKSASQGVVFPVSRLEKRAEKLSHKERRFIAAS
jgi:hypothetical protein